MTILDFAVFEKELYEASCPTIDAIWKDAENQGEHLYSFALVTTGLFGYIFPNVNTEEHLYKQAKQYILETNDFDCQIEMAIKYGRWEPTVYWRFFNKHCDHFERVNRILNDIDIGRALCELPDDKFDEITVRIEDIMFGVLSKLRADGYFGKEPDKFYANICYQDQSFEDLHRCALRVNSAEICVRMWNDLSDVMNYWNSKQ